MIWLAWRRQRTETLIALGLVALLAAWLVPVGLHMASVFDEPGPLASCIRTDARVPRPSSTRSRCASTRRGLSRGPELCPGPDWRPARGADPARARAAGRTASTGRRASPAGAPSSREGSVSPSSRRRRGAPPSPGSSPGGGAARPSPRPAWTTVSSTSRGPSDRLRALRDRALARSRSHHARAVPALAVGFAGYVGAPHLRHGLAPAAIRERRSRSSGT